MHPADIQAALLKAGTNQSRIAGGLRVSHNAVSLVIHGRGKSFRIAKAISRATGIPVNTLWPGRYQTPHRQQRKAA
ncbi:MAG: helix-turn-helix domain-containing protein [Pseudomonadota bacterium]